MGQCLSTPETSPDQQQSAGINQKHSTGRAPVKFSAKYEGRRNSRKYPNTSSDNFPGFGQRPAMSPTEGGVHQDLQQGSSKVTQSGLESSLMDTRNVEEQKDSTSATLELFMAQPRPQMPQSDSGEDQDESVEEESVESWNSEDFPEQLPFQQFQEFFFARVGALLEIKELQLKPQPEPSSTRSVLEKKYPATQKKLVSGDTLEIPERQFQKDDAMSPIGVGMMDLPITGELPSSDSPGATAAQYIEEKELTEVGRLGVGRSGRVHLVIWYGTEVAVKEFYGGSNNENERSQNQECTNLCMLKHPCVVALYGTCTFNKHPALVIEYVHGGSLKSQLRHLRKKEQGSLSRTALKTKLQLALQTASGLAYLHSKRLIHFDLKADNCLCDLRDITRPIVKIADVGLSKHRLSSFVSGNMRGTLPWMAPELIPGHGKTVERQSVSTDQVDDKVDIYSFGVVLWEIWTLGNDPFGGLAASDAIFGILSGTLKLSVPRDCPAPWAELMQKCWNPNPVLRPPIDTITQKLTHLLREQRF